MILRAEAFAKVNLSLSVLGRRPDGFHELDTVLQTIGLTDELTFRHARDLSLTVSDPALPAGEENLVVRAARALAARFGFLSGAAIHLLKRIPAAGGLGGGSSDAAATLTGLSALWGLAPAVAQLEEIGASLGCDVPFFLHGGTARGTGRGERIERLADTEGGALVLLFPPFGMATPEVFRELGAAGLTPLPTLSTLPGSGPTGFPDRNDLEPPAERLRPELSMLRRSLSAAGARVARLSGSGSTVFGTFPDEGTARRAAERLRNLPAGTGIQIARVVGREEFLGRSSPSPLMERSGSEETKRAWGVDKW